MSSVDVCQIINAAENPSERTTPARPLATRLTAWYLATSFLMVLISSAILYWAATSALQWADDQVTEKRMGAVRTLLQDEPPSDALVAHEVSDDNQGPRQIFIRVITDSEILAVETPDMSANLPASSFPDAATLPFDVLRRATIVLPDGRTYRALSARVPVSAKDGRREAVIQVATDTTLDAAGLAWFRRVLAGVVITALILSSLMGWQIVRSELEPLHRISAATAKISLKTLDYRVTTGGLPAELHELGDQFNKMLCRLESASTGLKQYADNVAHELRTPLHKILVGTEVALSKDRATQDYREALESNIEECNRLTRIVQGLLFLARADNGQATIERQKLDVGNELGVIQTYFDSSAAEAGVSLKVECNGNLQAHVDRILFQRAVSNLVSNSIAHTPRGGEVRIQAIDNENGVAIQVADTGEGIGLEHQSRIFDRFYRTNSVRSVDENRVGLGLSITRSIMELHGGNISLLSDLKRGTRITLTFPV